MAQCLGDFSRKYKNVSNPFMLLSGDVQQINVTLEEVARAPGRRRCSPVCIKVEWDKVPIADYRNVLFYTVSYREA